MFNYKWNLSDLENVPKNGLTVFSCFAGGGGSSQGYKMAGYDVIGCNEIDPRQMEIYKHNLKPRYSYLEDIRTFRERDDLPQELYELDILDASFPCSLFSSANLKADDKKGKEVKFREGQTKQTLDDLAFETIKLVDKLKPKICVFENVKGLLHEKNKWYVEQIYCQFKDIGYKICHHLIDCADLGVPQKRRRVFFFAVRDDIEVPTSDLFGEYPMIDLNIKEDHIPFKEIDTDEDYSENTCYPFLLKHYDVWDPGTSYDKTPHNTGFNYKKINPNNPIFTIPAHADGGTYHHKYKRQLNNDEYIAASSWSKDYDFLDQKIKYVLGMSVPPLAMYRIAKEIEKQWLTL